MISDDLRDPDYPRADANTAREHLSGSIDQLSPKKAVFIEPDATVRDAATKMREQKIGCVFVGRGGKILGLFTEKDLVARAGQRLEEIATLPVESVMRRTFTTLEAADPVAFCFHQMSVGAYRYCPVRLENGDWGVVSSRDLLRYLCT